MRKLAVVVVPLLLTLPSPAQRELLDDLPPDAEAWACRSFGPEFEPLVLPGKGPVTGLARHGEVVWLGRGDRLLGLSLPGWKVRQDVEAPAGLRGLCTGPRFLYALVEGGIAILDPLAGRAVGSVDCGEARDALAIAWHEGNLLVATKDSILGQDGEHGEWQERRPAPRRPLQWMVSAGGSLWGGTRGGLVCLGSLPAKDPTQWAERSWPWPLQASAAAVHDGRLLLVADALGGVDGKLSVAGLLTPLRRVEDKPQALSVNVYWTGTAPRYVIGPKPLKTLEHCKLELQRLAADPRVNGKRRDGSTGPLPVVIESHPGVRVKDLTAIWDVVTAAGFDRVCCPAEEAFARAERKRKALRAK